jgi:DNA adenine methylase
VAKPIVKWAGGKTRLLKHLVPFATERKIRVFAEPFMGGAALFFKLASMPERSFERAILADQNPELVATYLAVKKHVGRVLTALQKYADREDRRELYYETRELPTHKLGDVDRAARLIFLNRTGYNGLWRVNSKGKFNVPYGRYLNPKIVDPERLRAASEALALADIVHTDFLEVSRECEEGDFVYFDPPYVPLSKTATFTAYASQGFGPDDQERLAKEMRRLRDRGVRAMLSNAWNAETRRLYEGLEAEVVYAPRAINSDPSKRGEIAEVLVRNWKGGGR